MAIQFGSRQPGLDSDLNFNLTPAAITPIDRDSHACFLHINHDHRLCTPADGALTLVLDRLSFGVQDVTHYGAPWPLISLPNVPPDRKNVNIGVDCDTQALDPRIQAQTMVHLHRQRYVYYNGLFTPYPVRFSSILEDGFTSYPVPVLRTGVQLGVEPNAGLTSPTLVLKLFLANRCIVTSMWFTSKYVGYIGEALFLNSLVGFRELSGISAYGGNIDNTIYRCPASGLTFWTLTPALCPVLRTVEPPRSGGAMQCTQAANLNIENTTYQVPASGLRLPEQPPKADRQLPLQWFIRLDDVKVLGNRPRAADNSSRSPTLFLDPERVAFLVSAQADYFAQYPRMPLRHSTVVVSAQHDALEPASALESMQCDSSSACTGITAGAHKCKRDTTCDLHRLEWACSTPTRARRCGCAPIDAVVGGTTRLAGDGEGGRETAVAGLGKVSPRGMERAATSWME
ncbi:hypothetical protein C8R43DRAFT_1142930 [Mycena crocata]|nr:hypothetical protein C8R43DRAFT_1142930 [Mycena crocata]